jgi:hypothetical protein
MRTLAACLAAICLHAPPTAAQTNDGSPDPANVRVRLGPLWMNPTIALTNAGVDDNVFNDPADQAPKRDVTFTVTPKTDLWLHAGPGWVTGAIREDITWYQTYASERSADTTYTIGWRVPFSRLILRTGALYANTRERPGFEIDARAQRTQLQYDGGVEVQTFSRTFVGVVAQRQRVQFADDATFLGSNLHNELNATNTMMGLTVREQITALTSVTLQASQEKDRFEFSSLRDSNQTSVSGTIAFDPAALIKGSATIGYTNFEPLSPGLDGFKGLTTAVNLSYTMLGTTRFDVGANRNIQYSFDVNQPYYLLTGFRLSIAQQIFGPLDVVGRIGRENLAYRDRAGATIEAPNRVDQVLTYGGGIGYHLGKQLRLGFNVDNSRRTSPIAERSYQGLRVGTALTYGL